MKKIEAEGWISKYWEGKEESFIFPFDGMISLSLADKQGTKEDWEPDDWPPKKVRITIEEVE